MADDESPSVPAGIFVLHILTFEIAVGTAIDLHVSPGRWVFGLLAGEGDISPVEDTLDTVVQMPGSG